MNYDTIIKQYAKKPVKDYVSEFYSFIFCLINNLVETDLDHNLKLVFINALMLDKQIVFFKNKEDKLQIGRLSQVLTRDENLLPIDIKARTLNGNSYDLIEPNYVLLYNPIPTDYLALKLSEIAKIESIVEYLRKLYKSPVIFQSKDTKALRSVKEFIHNLFSTEEICTIVNESFDVSKKLDKIELNIPYITDKLLEENESLKEDILETLGIYKNTSGNRERVNESELIISNSLTTVNKLGLENALINTFKEIETKLGFKYNVELNINKIFDTMKGGTVNE